MNKLEVGKWYRDQCPNNLYYCSNYHEKINEYDLIKYFNGIKIICVVSSRPYRFKPLETLTPREALILLANRFTLKQHFYEYKIFDGKLKYREIRDLAHGPNPFLNVSICGFEGFTIHALPEAGE